MATKHIYAKSVSGVSDFVYVDLLPDVKRSRQFNMNVIGALFLGVFLSYVLLYMPFRTLTEEHETLNALNNDLQHELMLTNEEFLGYEINLDIIVFEENIDNLVIHKVDYNNFLDDIELLSDEHEGTIIYTSYLAETSELHVTIVNSSQYSFNILNNDLLELPWVSTSDYSVPIRTGDAVQYSATYTLGVDLDAE